MPLNLNNLHRDAASPKQTHPREIFRAQQKREPKRYEFPRDVQTQVWNAWHERRTEKDLVVKANTGSGKTVVGLLVLQSCLNEGIGPAAFFTPNKYLADQAKREALGLGLDIATEPDDLEYIRGRAILITNIYKLFNGLSVFGVDTIKSEIGSLVIDDAHACLAAVEEQFTVFVSASESPDAFTSIYQLVKQGLVHRYPNTAVEWESGKLERDVEVPFWVWSEHLDKLRPILHSLTNDGEKPPLRFSLPLLRDELEDCRCVLSQSGFEITPRLLPVEKIPSFMNAKRRIFMSATFADDNVFITQFGVNPSAMQRLIVPEIANDIGDRMILVPQALNPGLSENDVKAYVKMKSKELSAVVIVPSKRRADEFWSDAADQILMGEEVHTGVSTLRQSSNPTGLTVLVNRYDGIDLPDDACRLLVLDGLPDVRRSVDRVDQGALISSTLPRTEVAHRIEQGMGRATRSAEDYAAVLLMGSSLVQQLYERKAVDRFSEATRAQMELSEEIGEQIKGEGVDAMNDAIQKCLDRDKHWVGLSRDRLSGLKYDDSATVDTDAKARRDAFETLRSGQPQEAADQLRLIAERIDEHATKGYLFQEVAAIQHRFDPNLAQRTLRYAKGLNRGIMSPLEGISYERLQPNDATQGVQAYQYLTSRYNKKGNELLIGVNALLEHLTYRPGEQNSLEEAIKEVALHLGMVAQRPEHEFGEGPDDLWALGGATFAIIEAKGGTTTNFISKTDCNQLGGSVRWFDSTYRGLGTCTPVMFHPVRDAASDATPPNGAWVVTSDKLEELRQAVREWGESVASRTGFGSEQDLTVDLKSRQLMGDSILGRFSVPMRSSR
jgi:hypothetical protein